MYNRIRARILEFMRVPPDPEPPAGTPGSIRAFRAGRNYYYVRLLRWGAAQIGALVGILFSIGFLMKLSTDIENFHARQAAAATAATVTETRASTSPTPPSEAVTSESPAATVSSAPSLTTTETDVPAVAPESQSVQKKKSRRARNARDGYAVFVSKVPRWLVHLMNLGEIVGIGLFVLQLPVTFVAARLDWELRRYIVTDRSLRIRTGLASLQETTMSFANLQQVEVRQGPLQRLLGIADVRVQSAGGGGGESQSHQPRDSLHTGVFEGVENAHEIRDLILARLKRFREAGLGDPEDVHALAAASKHASSTATTPSASAANRDTLTAARELLEAARALRAAVEKRANG